MSIQQAILFDGWKIPTLESFCADHFNPSNKKETTFAGWQEAAQKDVECAFMVLQAKWCLLASPVEMWDEYIFRTWLFHSLCCTTCWYRSDQKLERNAQGTTFKKVCHKTMTMMMGIAILLTS